MANATPVLYQQYLLDVQNQGNNMGMPPNSNAEVIDADIPIYI